MKFLKWHKGVKDKDQIYFRLIQGERSIGLMAVDHEGKTIKNGCILELAKIRSDGASTIVLQNNLSDKVKILKDLDDSAIAYKEWEVKAMRHFFMDRNSEYERTPENLSKILESLINIKKSVEK